jgi:hypothetical protein
LDVRIWTEEDGSWGAHSDLLGVSAIADTEVELYAEFAEQLDEFWAILNERFETLSEDLKRLLDLRGQTFRFIRT